jgi:hypothetical protein
MLLELNEQERQLLQEVLSTALGTLREEIYKTESAPYEAMLKQREVTLLQLQARVAAAGPVASSAT